MNDPPNKAAPSKIELAKALRQVKGIAGRDQYDAIRKILDNGLGDDLSRAVAGLGEEEEFVLMCILMDTTTHLAPLEQRPSIALHRAAPDLIAKFKPGFFRKSLSAAEHNGFKCFVEVKSTEKEVFTIGGKHLQKLRHFADSFSMPLLFAVRFLKFSQYAVWVIVEDSDRSSRSLKISIEDWIKGLRPTLWNEESYMMVPGTAFEAIYVPKTGASRGIIHPEHGELVAFAISNSGRREELTGMTGEIAAAFFHSYILEEAKVDIQAGRKVVTLLPQSGSLSVADLLYSLNRLVRDGDGNLIFDASVVLRELADGHQRALFTRDFITHYALQFCDLGALFLMGYGTPEDSYKKWLATGGTPQKT